MAIVELQFREQAFGELLMRQVNSRRLPSPTLTDGPPDVVGRLLDKITAVACELVSEKSGELTGPSTCRSSATTAPPWRRRPAASSNRPRARAASGSRSRSRSRSFSPPGLVPEARAALSYASLFAGKGSMDLDA